MSERFHEQPYGKTIRKDFSKIKNVLDIPYLVQVQKKSYEDFLGEGIREVFRDYSPIISFSGRYKLEFLDHYLTGEPKYTVKECKDRDTTYARPLKVRARLTNNETGEITEEEVFMGEFPLMTDSGSFIINGAERVVVSQLARSPGVYNTMALDKNGVPRFSNQVIPNRGAWLEYEQDQNGIEWVKVDRQRKITATTLLRALLPKGTDEELIALFGNDPMIIATCERDTNCKSREQGRLDLFKRMRPGEVPTLEGADNLIKNTFFDFKRYELARVGRYKYNKKLALATRIAGYPLAEDIIDTETGEVLFEKGSILTEEQANDVQNKGINEVWLAYKENGEDKKFKVIGNNTVDFEAVTGLNAKECGIKEKVYYPLLKEFMKEFQGDELALAVKANEENSQVESLCTKHITVDDIFAVTSYNLGLVHGFGQTDDIDHLSNRRVRAVGELLQNQFRVGISRLEKVVKEKMNSVADDAVLTPKTLINIRPITSAIKEFFGSSQLSQFMDQPNPIAELTHKRKLSSLGPGGLNRERAGLEVRDVHHSHYGRMCPIETPEGQNIGLITSLTAYARVNEYGFIETPYRKIDKATGIVTDQIVYMTADEEDKYVVVQANEPLDKDGRFVNEMVSCRDKNDICKKSRDKVDYMDVSPKQVISIATALVPFLEHDDINRALMGSNMQRQAVPLLKPEAPMIATGVEHKIAYDSGILKIAKKDGVVEYVDSTVVKVRETDGNLAEYKLSKFERSNQSTCINQRPAVSKGEKVIGEIRDEEGNVKVEGTVLADGPATENGELSLGRNMLIGFMSWEGYNYEDAVLISEELVRDDVYTSIHIEKREIECRETKLGDEQITRDIPNLSEDALKNLDEDGIIRIGAEVRPGDILVGKVTPKGETDLTPEERLFRAIFGDKSRDVRDTSLRVPNGEGGIVVDVKIFTKKNRDELAPGVTKLVRVYIAQKRKISVGDKMAGRHGNKGVVSRVLPREDMPYLPDGTPLQIVLNPLGVPSRMNIGQVLEVHLGLIAKQLDWKIATPVFDGACEEDIKALAETVETVESFQNRGIQLLTDGQFDGKIQLYDGRTGEPFENRATVGYMYYLKLHHLVDDKIHARSNGPYSLVTQQPLGGKAQFGGQRFGEMEVWALEAYGAANILQEILTVKSDDVVGRVKTYESIVKGTYASEPGIPESFKVLVKELQSLGLDVIVKTDAGEEVNIRDNDEELDFEVQNKDEQKTTTVDLFVDNLFDQPELGGESGDEFSFDDISDDESLFDIMKQGEDQYEDPDNPENFD
ncbi:MAG: DNA-directed RNA polymerase subunit beta [Clostridia bacterium]|nr:DNA-directed RNA polymerase subunit beta [Clostridia bacterium]